MDFDRSLAAIEELRTREKADSRIATAGYSRLFAHERPTARAVVFFHGFTNCPEQFAELGRRFHERGDTVYIPRLPHHGYKDRRTSALAALTPADLELVALEAVILAAGLGERVYVIGLSLGGLLATWIGQTVAVAGTVAIAPLLALATPQWLNLAVPRILRTLPNVYIWWDPLHRAVGRRTPPYAYPGFPSRALCANFALRDEVIKRMRLQKPRSPFAALVLNDRDNIVSNAGASALYGLWRAAGASIVEIVLSDLHAHHDIIDPWHQHLPLERIYSSIEALVP